MSRPLLDQAVYKFIDAKLSKDGRITSVDVSKAFGLGRQKVSSVFTKYRTDYPQNMHHDVHQKCYVRGCGFEAVQLNQISPEEYLNAVNVVSVSRPTNGDKFVFQQKFKYILNAKSVNLGEVALANPMAISEVVRVDGRSYRITDIWHSDFVNSFLNRMRTIKE